jgi:hypothetical protein
MNDSLDLDRLRQEAPHCAGIAWFAGSPLHLVAASGEPAAAAWSSWDEIAEAAPALLRDGPVASPEVLLRLPDAMLLLAERPTGVVAVVVELTQGAAGMAVVEARMTASQVGA